MRYEKLNSVEKKQTVAKSVGKKMVYMPNRREKHE